MKSSFFAAASSILVAFASAYTQPYGQNIGNPTITPAVNDIVAAGSPYTLTWTPTSEGTVTIILLRGPGTNVQPLYPIVEAIPNTGSYTWTPSTDLEADVTHYAYQIVDDANGNYQYSPQWGISNTFSSSSIVSTTSVASSTPIASTTSIIPATSTPEATSVTVPTTTSSVPAVETSIINSNSSIPVTSDSIDLEEATTIVHTNIVTVTSCGPTVSNCPARSTTVAPVVTIPTSAVIKSSTYWSNSTLTTTTSSSGVASTGFAVSTTALPSQFTGAGDKIRVGCAMGAIMVAALALAL